jgi:hypothetical protein
MDLSNIGTSGEVPKIDLFKEGILKKGNLEKILDKAASIPLDSFQSGKWQSHYKTPADNQKYLATLGGKPLERFGPHGFFKELGLPKDPTITRITRPVPAAISAGNLTAAKTARKIPG